MTAAGRVLVTGASGFIGARALRALAARGFEVHAVARGGAPGDAPGEVHAVAPGGAPGDAPAGVAWHAADLLDGAARRELVEAVGASHLLHLAWYAEPGAFWTSRRNAPWVAATVGLVDEFAAAGGRRAVLAGSCAEYDWSAPQPLAEDAALRPATYYGVCKDATRRVVAGLAEQAGLELAWGRIFFVYGPREDERRLVASVARALVAGERAPTSAGTQRRDFMHVDDVAGAFAALLDSAVAGAVNIASGEPVEVREIVAGLGRAAGRGDLLDVGALPARPGEPAEIVADVTRLRDEVSFVPRIESAARARGDARLVARPVADLLDSAAAGPVAARGGALRALGYGAGTLLAVLSAPLMIRHLGVEGYGRYVTVLSLVTVVTAFADAGLVTITLREYASRSGADRDAVMRDLLGIRIALGLAAGAIAVLFALVAGYPPVQVFGTAAIGAAFFIWSVQTVLAASLQGELRFGWIAAVELLRQAIFVALVVVLVVAGAGLGSFYVVMIPASAIGLAITVVLVRRLMPLRPAFHPGHWWPLLKDTLTYAAAVALNAAYFRIAVVALSLLATERETGLFATAFRVTEVLIGVPQLVVGAAFPILARAARDDRDRLDSATSRLIEVALVMGVWLALALSLGAEPIIFVLAGDGSEPSIDLLRLLAVALVATFVTVAGGYALLSLRRHRAILLANVVALAVGVVLMLVLVTSEGATGAALAVLTGELVLMACVLFALVRERPAVAEALRRAPAILAAGALAALVVLVPGLPPLADAAAGVVAFPALLLAFRRFPPEIGHALRGRDEQAVV